MDKRRVDGPGRILVRYRLKLRVSEYMPVTLDARILAILAVKNTCQWLLKRVLETAMSQ